MDSPQFRRIFYGLLAFGFLAVTARELYQFGITRDAIITTVFGLWMWYLSHRATKEIGKQEPPPADATPPASETKA